MTRRVVMLCLALLVVPAFARAAVTFPARGTVVGTDGKPVAGVRVYAVMVRNEVRVISSVKAATVSDPDGAFELPPITYQDPGLILYLIAFEPDRFLGWSTHYLDFEETPSVLAEGVKIVVSKPSSARGRVADGDGRPIAGASVRCRGMASRDGGAYAGASADGLASVVRLCAAVTGPDGAYEVRGIPEHCSAFLIASKRGWAMVPKPLRQGEETMSSIVLIPGGQIAGRLVDARGKGIPNAIVTTQPRGLGSVMTGKDGSFLTEGLVPGKYGLVVSRTWGNQTDLKWNEIRVAAGKTTHVGRMVRPVAVTVAGRVVDEETGKPISGARIAAGGDLYHSASASADKNGLYTLRVPSGSAFIVYAGGNSEYRSDLPDIGRPVVVPKTGLKNHIIRVRHAEMVSGIVVDANGAPIEGAEVSIGRRDEGRVTISDAKGAFAVPMPPPDTGG